MEQLGVVLLMMMPVASEERIVCVNGYAYRLASCTNSDQHFGAVLSFDMEKPVQLEYMGYPDTKEIVEYSKAKITLAVAEGCLQYIHRGARWR